MAQNPHRDRQPSARSTSPPTAIGARRPQRSLQNFRIGGERMPIADRARARHRQAGRGGDQPRRSARSTRGAPAPSSAPRSEVIDGKLDDHFPLVVWQTGSGTQTNMNVNEVIANRANESARRQARREGAGASQRSRQHEPVVERLLPDRDAYRGGRWKSRKRCCRRWRICTPRCERKAKAFAQHRQDRPHPYAGCDAADARPGIFRLRRAGANRHRARIEAAMRHLYPLAQGGTAVGTGLNSQAEFAEPFARRVAEITKLPFVSAPNKFEALAAHDAYVFVHGALERGRDRPVQDRQRHPPARLRPALGPRRIDPAGERARLLDHAGQGQPDPERGADHGVLPGVRQSHHDHRRRRARAISSSTSTSR